MSLINKVLRDLDARSTTRGPSMPKSVHRGLRPAAAMYGRKRPQWLAPALTLVAVVGVYMGASATFFPLPYSEYFLDAVGLTQKPDVVRVVTAPAVRADASAVSIAPPVVPVAPEKRLDVSAVPTVKSTATAAPAPVVKPAKKANLVVVKKPVEKNKPAKVATRKIAPIPKPAAAPEEKVAVVKEQGELKIQAKPISAGEKAENTFREGAIALEQGNHVLAEQKLHQTLQDNPRHAQAAELLAGVLISSGRGADARRVLTSALTQLSGHAQLSHLLARLYVDQGNDTDAIRVLEQAQKRNKTDANLMSFRAALYQRGSRHPDAAQAYRDALAVVPNEGKWWVGLGISLEAQRDWKGARSAYEKAQAANLSAQLAQYAQQRLIAVKASQ